MLIRATSRRTGLIRRQTGFFCRANEPVRWRMKPVRQQMKPVLLVLVIFAGVSSSEPALNCFFLRTYVDLFIFEEYSKLLKYTNNSPKMRKTHSCPA